MTKIDGNMSRAAIESAQRKAEWKKNEARRQALSPLSEALVAAKRAGTAALLANAMGHSPQAFTQAINVAAMGNIPGVSPSLWGDTYRRVMATR